jgi:drug/metabolite transporter (DMT)-like permease
MLDVTAARSTEELLPDRAASIQYWAGLTAVVLATLLWSVGAVVASALFRHGVSPLELVELRTYVTALGLAGLASWVTRSQPQARRSIIGHRWLLLGFGLAIAVANTSLFLAIKHLPVAVAMVLQNLAPAFVIAWVLLTTRRAPSARVMIGMVFALTGVALVVQLPIAPLRDIDLLGVLFGLTTALGVAGFSVLGERATKVYGAIRANSMAFAIAAAAWVLVQAPHGAPDLLWHPELFGQVAVVGVLGTLAPFVLFAWGTARLGSEAGALGISLEPIFSAAIAWVWLNQLLSAMQIVGAAMIIAGIVHTQRRNHDPTT